MNRVMTEIDSSTGGLAGEALHRDRMVLRRTT
jgi:hypothetical protein